MNYSSEDLKKVVTSLRISIYDGIFAQSFAILTGGLFLPAFALILGATPFFIGILASIPFLANIVQLLGAFLIERYRNRKQLTILTATFARSFWILLILISFFLGSKNPKLVLISLLSVAIGYHILAALSGVSWLSWMSHLVPENIRGRYFGLRNSILGIVTVIITWFGSFFLDSFNNISPTIPQNHAFEFLFSIGVLFAFISIYFLYKQQEVPAVFDSKIKFKNFLSEIFKDKKFIRYIKFTMVWSFAVNFASPFYIVYLIEDLHISYTLVGTFTIISALANISGMWIWGYLSDHLGNRPIIILSTLIASILPFLWIFTNSSNFSIYYFIPFLHALGGLIWAGYNLCSVNLLLRMVPPQGNSIYFAFWSVLNGLSAGIGALTGGLVTELTEPILNILPYSINSTYIIIFFISTFLRFSSIFLVRKITEEKGLPFFKAIRVLRSIRTWASMMGFHPAIHFMMTDKTSGGEDSDLWPLWKRTKIKEKNKRK